MNITLNVKFDEQTLAALSGIGAALLSQTGQSAVAGDQTADEGPFLWGNHSSGEFGKVATKADYDALKRTDKGIVRLTEAQYKDMQAKAKAKADDDKKAKAEAAKAEKAEKAEAAKAEKKKAAKTEKADGPTKEELIAIFTEFLPKDLEADERTERQNFVRALLTRFGARKITETKEEHWPLILNLVSRRMDGEDIDPESGDFADSCAESENSDDDMI